MMDYMIYIHPPLTIAGYVFIILSMAGNILKDERVIKWLFLAWLFNFLGLVTGMIWAEYAWGAWWSWDPKEVVTLFLFITTSLSYIFYEKRRDFAEILLFLSAILIIINVFITFSGFGLHSYG